MTPGREWKPVRAELSRVALPLRAPVVAAHGTEQQRHTILVRLDDEDGSSGWGECPALSLPTYTHEHVEGAWWVLVNLIVPEVLAGRSAPGTHPMASGAVAAAVADIEARRDGVSLAAALGGSRTGVGFTAVLGLDSPKATVEAAERAVEGGASLVKCKVAPGRTDGVRAVRENRPDLALAADANGSLDPDGADLAVLDGLDLVYLEQPLPADDLVGSAALVRALRTKVCLDESITSQRTLETALALGALEVLNVKPARTGGPVAAAQIARKAAGEGIEVLVGGMIESAVGRAGALAVASLEACGLPADLAPSDWSFAADVVADPPAPVQGPGAVKVSGAGQATMPVPQGPGLGVVPDPSLLEFLVVDRVVVS